MTERSADELEAAEEIREQIRDDGLARVRAQLTQSHPDFDGIHCVNPKCGEELPPVRIAYKRVRCAPCQQALEDRDRRMGRRA